MSASCPKSCLVLVGASCCGSKRPVQPGVEGQGGVGELGEGLHFKPRGLGVASGAEVEAQELLGTTGQLGY